MKKSAKSKMELTFAERYDMDYERGYRQGSINAVRELLLNAFKVRGEEQNYKVSKELLRKIQYETDTAYLKKLMFMAIKDDVNLKDVEEKYDEIFRTKKR